MNSPFLNINKRSISLLFLFLLFVGILLFYTIVFEINSFHCDDAFITYRYARNLNSGLGLVYNKGENVFGTSTPLYAVLLAFTHRITNVFVRVDYHPLSQIISLIAFSGAIMVLSAICTLGVIESMALFLILLFSPFNFTILFSGMETFTVVFFLLLFLKNADNQKALLYLVIVILLRLDVGLMAATTFVLYFSIQSAMGGMDKASFFKKIAIVLLGGMAYAAVTMLFFHSLVPHTIIAKKVLYTQSGWFQSFAERLHIVIRMGYPIFFSIPLIGAAMFHGFSLVKRSQTRGLQYLIYLIAYSAFQVTLVGRIQAWYLPYLPFLLIVFVTLGSQNYFKNARVGFRVAGILLLAVGISSYMVLRNTRNHNPSRSFFTSFKNNLFSDELFTLARMIPETNKVFCGDIGVIGFYSNAYIYDYAGLVSKKAVSYNKSKTYYKDSRSYNLSSEMLLTQIEIEKPDVVVLRKSYPFVNGIVRNNRFQTHYATLFSGQREIAFRKVADFWPAESGK